MLSGDKELAEPMSTEFYVAIRCHHWHHATLPNGAVWWHRSWAHFTANNSSMLMQVWWKFHSAIVGFSMKVIAVKFCARHDSCTFVACVKFCSDMIPNHGVTQKPKISLEFESRRKIFREMGPWFIIGSGNGVFPDEPKQLPEQLLNTQ